MENSYNDDPLGILSKPKQKQAAPSQEGGNDPLGILKKKAAPEPVGTPSANGTPPTSPSKSSSSSVSVQPTVIASSGNQVKDLVDYVKGTGSFDNAKAANSEAAQKAIPKIVARQAARQKPLTEAGATPRPKVLSEQDAQAKAKEALSDPLMNVWASRSPDPIGELQKGANAAYDGTKAFTVRNGNDASVYGQMAKIAERSFLPNETAASAYLKSRGVDVEGVPDADLATIEPRNVTEKVALDRVSQGRTIKNLLATSTVEDAAVEYAASQDPALARQIQTLGTNYQHDLPNAMQGKLISDFLENPDVIARAEVDPNVKNKYTVAAANLNSNFPDYAKTRIANIIGQERENRGDNNGLVNIVGQKATDKLVDELIAEGKLTASDKLIYQKYIQPKLSVLQSIGRGVGRAIPLTMAFTDEAPIETPGLAENFQNSLVGTLHGMAKSIEDTPSALGSVVGGDQSGKLYDVLKNDYTAKALDPKGTWHAITQNTGHLTGFMVPMILGGEVAQGVGIPTKAASALTAYLTFEGQNAEQAIKMFPGDPTKQYLHTALATGGDMFLSELLPLAKAASGAKAALRSEITNTINSFTDGNISAAVAKETLLKKAAKIVAGLPKENAKMGATMAGFSLFHNALDAAFGGRDVSAGQVADQAVDAFKSGFLGGSIISLATAGNNQKLTGSLVREMAERPDHFKALIEQGAKMDPSLAATANERIANLNEASLIWKDVQELPLSDAQKEKYLLSALNQKVWERKAEATSDDVVKRGYQEKAKVAGQAKEAIYNGQDPATEHKSFAEVARTTPPTESELAQDVKNGRLTTVEFNDETEVPEIWKDKISSSGTINGKKTVRVTLPTSQYEFDSRGGKSPAPADTFGYKEKIAAATTEQEKEQIAKEYADYLSAQQKTANEPKAEQPLSNDEVANLNSRKAEIQSLLASDAASNEKHGQGSLIPEARKELLSELEGIKAKLGAAPKEEAAKAPDDTHLIVSSDTKSALANQRKKQVVVEEDGKPVVKEEDFTQEDAEVELDRLEFLAEKGRLTPEQFQNSYFGQAVDQTTFKAASEIIKTDAKGFIADLRKSFEAKDEQKGNPLVPRGELIDQARELVRNSEIKGYTSETIKDAAENDPAKFEDYLQNIAEQAKDPGSRAVTLDTYGKDIVDLAERLSDSKQTSKNNNVTLSNGEQPTVSNRLSPEEKRGNQIGGSELQAASDAVGRISDTSENNKASVEELRDKQGKELEQISKNNGTWVADPFKEFGNAPQAIGSEHNVYLDKDGQTLTKLNSAVKYDTWQDYLDNLAIHNTLFPTEAYTLKGFTDLSGDLTAVVQQPVVRGKEATFEQVKEDMAKMGFEHIPTSENPETPYDFVNKKTGVVISDLHGENVLVDANGNLRYIDTVIKKKPVENEATIPPTETSATDQGTTENSQGAKEATKFENPEEAVKHINSLPLSHVEGTRMGAKQAEGVYLSTEDANRYSSESNPARSVTVDIKNPKVTDYVENTNLQHEKIGQLLDANEVSASDISSEYRPELEKFAGKSDVTNEDVSNWYRSKEGNRINEDYFEQTVRTRAAKLITEQYKSEGHDALYIPATKNTEGELIVFDSNAVKFEPANDLSKEQKYTTKTGKYSVEYRDGKRVVVDKQGNVLPEYIKVKAKKGIIQDKDGNPRMVDQRNRVRDTVLREHEESYKYNFGAKADPNEMPGGLSDKQAGEWVIENSSNPAELANLYASTPKEKAGLNEIEQAIADNGIGKVKAKSYYNFGDRNNMTATKARTYLNDTKGRSIDVIAKEIADHTGLDVTPQDIVDFIDRFPKGDATVLRDGELHQQAATKFEELTGIPLTERVAEKAALDHYAAVKREAEEVAIARDTPDEEIKKWITETVENEYSTDNFSDFIGESTDPIRQDKKEPGNVEGVSENTGTEMAGRPATSAEQGRLETTDSEGENGPPAENGATTVETHSEDWTPINKAQLTEAETLLKKFPFGKSETWDNSVSKGIASLAKEAVNSESLYETASRKVTGWAEQIKRAIDSDGKSTFNPSDEEIAQMAFHRVMTNKQIGELEADLTSPIEAIRNAAELTMDNLQSQKEMVDYVLHNTATTAGRAFNIRQMVGRIDSENNLQVKRMEIIRKQGGEPLSEKQELALRDIADESAIIAKERAELEKKKADQDFEAAVKIEVERRLKEKGANKTTSIKEGGKKVADVIRSLKMPKGGLRSDFTLGTWDIAIEGIAKIVEGGASIADAVKKLIEDKVIAFKDENARNLFEEYVTNYEKHDIVGRIEELANEEGSNTLTKSAVGEGTINDLVRHYIDKGVRGNEILERVHQDLQSVFPEISKQDIRDAYLKEGEYRFEKKEDINRETQAATQQLKTIAKLQTDLSDLQNERELRKRSGEKREPTAEEKSLQSEKEELLKKKRVEEVNKRIKEVNDRLDVLKNNRNKKTERVDADIEAARKRLQSEIGKLGLKLERGSKDEKALKEPVAEQHNKRADNIIEGIDKRLTDPKITAQERAALENAKKSIEKSKISPDSALDLSRAISKAHENIELGRKELASISSLSDLKKQTGLAQVEMGRDQISAEQQILLDRYKKTLQNKINENNRRIAAKEYLDKEPTYLKSTDAEAIKLEIQERQVNAKFNKLAKDAQWQNMSRRQKAFNVIQNLYIASLVGHMSTLAKVAASAVTKQPLNTITSQTFGRIGGRIFSKIRPALRGEGAESLRKETQRYKAHYGVMGENKMLRIAAEGKEKAQQANEKFNKAKDRLEELETINGTDSKEYKSFLSGEYKKAETAQKKALLDNISNSMYEWIGGNSFKDAAELFLHSAPQLEQILGKSPRESWGEYNKREKVMFVLSSIAATHGVLKNFSARAEFAASFVARLENKMRNGIDISTPDEILKTVNENYINFQRGKYQEDNPITGGFKAALNGIEKMGERNPQFKTAADIMTGLLKFENPIVRTPINIAKEAIVEYALGVPVAIMKYRGALKEAKTEAKTIGVAANEMKQYLREYMAKLDPDKADFIYRAFRKGGFGLGMMALAATGAVQFGGFYNRDDRRKKSEKLGVGEIQIGDYQLSKLQAKILTHTSAIFPLLLWTNYERVKEKQERKGKDTVDSNWEATKEDIQGMIDQVPIGTEFQNPLRGVNIPVVGPIMQDIAEGIDTDESGNKIERKPTGNVLNQLWQGMEMRIPVARENVPKKKK